MSRLRKPYTMELTIMVGKAKVHKSAVIRERCKRRLREAIRLVVTRGAGKKQEGEDVVYDEEKRGVRKWLVPGESTGDGRVASHRGRTTGSTVERLQGKRQFLRL